MGYTIDHKARGYSFNQYGLMLDSFLPFTPMTSGALRRTVGMNFVWDLGSSYPKSSLTGYI